MFLLNVSTQMIHMTTETGCQSKSMLHSVGAHPFVFAPWLLLARVAWILSNTSKRSSFGCAPRAPQSRWPAADWRWRFLRSPCWCLGPWILGLHGHTEPHQCQNMKPWKLVWIVVWTVVIEFSRLFDRHAFSRLLSWAYVYCRDSKLKVVGAVSSLTMSLQRCSLLSVFGSATVVYKM